MTIYLVLFLVLSVCAILSCGEMPNRAKDIMYWFCAGLLLCLSGFRGLNVGSDTRSYRIAFEQIQRLSLHQMLTCGWEQGYVLLNRALAFVSQSDRYFLIVMAALILIPFFLWIKRESKWPCLSLVVFVGMGMWMQSMFVMRQWCAMALLTFSYRYIRERRIVPFTVLVVLAMMFHRTAGVFLLAYFVPMLPLNSVTLTFGLAGAGFLWAGGDVIWKTLNLLAHATDIRGNEGGYTMLLILWFCVLMIYLLLGRVIPAGMNLSYGMVLVAAALQPVVFAFSGWARIVQYFSISIVLLLPNFLAEWTEEVNQKYRIPFGMLLCLAMLGWFFTTGPESYVFLNG